MTKKKKLGFGLAIFLIALLAIISQFQAATSIALTLPDTIKPIPLEYIEVDLTAKSLYQYSLQLLIELY